MSDILTRVHSDVGERRYTFERVQDVEPYLDRNSRLRSQPQKSDWGRHVASVPNIILEKWFNEYNEGRNPPDLKMFGDEFMNFVYRKLQDSEFSKLRVD